MHRSVLQNKKYIKFAYDNTVEVMAMGRLQEGIDKNDPKAETYTTKDANGNKVVYLKEFPNLTVEEALALRSSKAGTYNDTGGIPYTAIVDPFTLEKLAFFKGGQSSKTIIDSVTEWKRVLNKQHGPSLKRSDLMAFRKGMASVEALLGDKGAAKALIAYKKFERNAKKMGEDMLERAQSFKARRLLSAAKEELDRAEALIESGDLKAAKKLLGSLSRALKKTELHPRALELLERTKSTD